MKQLPGDLDHDGDVDLDDFVIFKRGMASQLYGDVDGDGDTDMDDFVILKQNFGQAIEIVLVFPTTTKSSIVYQSFDGPLFTSGTEATDIDQGGLADCYFLAALAALAHEDGGDSYIRDVIGLVGDGVYGVTMTAWDGSESTIYIDSQLPVTSTGAIAYAKTGDGGELWVALLEKAWAHFRYEADSYQSTEYGWSDSVFLAMGVDHVVSWYVNTFTEEALFVALMEQEALGNAVTLSTKTTTTSLVVANHVYVVLDADYVAGEPIITVYNPWATPPVQLTPEQVKTDFLMMTVAYVG